MKECKNRDFIDQRAEHQNGRRATDHVKRWPLIVTLTLVYIATCTVVLLHYYLITALTK